MRLEPSSRGLASKRADFPGIECARSALAEQGCQREQAELALARETELMVTEKTRRAIGAACDFVTLPPTSLDTLIIREPEMLEKKFEGRFPTHQNAIDIFGDRWASNIGEVYPGLTSGPGPYFSVDRRPSIAAQYLGFEPGSLEGMNILELGPLEGAHTYQLAKLGADRILAIEANAEAFLKCLVVKEILRTPRCRFLLGDCLKFLQESRGQFDMIFCSGVLYHMANPFELIKAISRHTGRVFLWTHYYDPDIPLEPARSPKVVICDGLELTFYEQAYGDPDYGKFWGGNAPTASWLSREAIEQCFRHFGYDLSVHEDNRATQAGHHITATALLQADGV
jgi:2-polyprenyl-3-methyl-5-hydroxy-6-metoxy-1,4-benzoquinol methylase